jgi:hypothetical protein
VGSTNSHLRNPAPLVIAAAAALSVLTDGRRVSVINAPAGAGLGPVVGITSSQSARNTLAAGVTDSYNSARFLGHLPGKRGARGPVETGPGTLMVIDEASMMSGLDLTDLISLAGELGGKVILAGDTEQLQAVQNGGGMSLLADRLGLVPPGPVVRIPDGTVASCGDLIVCTRNDRRVEAGEPGRTLANGDLPRIHAVTEAGLLVRRGLGGRAVYRCCLSGCAEHAFLHVAPTTISAL